MARTAVYRRLDRFCRIVLPAELRQGLDLKGGTALEFHLEGDTMILSRPRAGCAFCGETDDLRAYRGRRICGACRRSLRMRMARTAAAIVTSGEVLGAAAGRAGGSVPPP